MQDNPMQDNPTQQGSTQQGSTQPGSTQQGPRQGSPTQDRQSQDSPTQDRPWLDRRWRIAGAGAVAVALAVAAVALAVAASEPSAASQSVSDLCNSSAPKLTVQGTGEASAAPDVLTVSIDIDVTQPGAQASLVADNDRAAAVTAVLEQGGVALKDIQTSNVSIQPQYNLTGLITGYEMTNTITAKLRDFARAGSVLDDLTAAAGNATRIDSLTFTIEDPRGIEDQARTDAVHQAVSHAQSMARAAGERLGPVCSLSDTSTPIYPDQFYGATRAADSQAAVPLQPGTQQESAQVSLVYALEQPGTRS
jgi:uncharacterized protein